MIWNKSLFLLSISQLLLQSRSLNWHIWAHKIAICFNFVWSSFPLVTNCNLTCFYYSSCNLVLTNCNLTCFYHLSCNLFIQHNHYCNLIQFIWSINTNLNLNLASWMCMCLICMYKWYLLSLSLWSPINWYVEIKICKRISY